MRAQYQILVFPYIKNGGKYEYALFQREDSGAWQGIAGGGESGESHLESARRETYEEAQIPKTSRYIELRSVGQIPAKAISAFKNLDIEFVPEYSFGVEVGIKKLVIGHEHLNYGWFSYADALNKLMWESNKKALTELNSRLI